MKNIYELVWIETKDNLELYGLLTSDKQDKILINIHGTASNFYEEDFIGSLAQELPKVGTAVLSTNNRGAGVYDAYQKSGAAVEKFEDCLLDIDAWIEFVLKRGFKEIFLSGHSLGTEKVVYYMNYGKYKDKVKAVILFAPADSAGYAIYGDDYKPSSQDKERVDKLLIQAKKLIGEGRGEVFLDREAYAGIMPKSAESFVNFSYLNPRLLQGLSFHRHRLESFSKIRVPILVAIGNEYEYTAIPIEEALELMERENSLAETHLIKSCNHDFQGKEQELTSIVKKFLSKI
jgi:alpha-beta hydrolase superfamily lysophospholipase